MRHAYDSEVASCLTVGLHLVSSKSISHTGFQSAVVMETVLRQSKPKASRQKSPMGWRLSNLLRIDCEAAPEVIFPPEGRRAEPVFILAWPIVFHGPGSLYFGSQSMELAVIVPPDSPLLNSCQLMQYLKILKP